jgi:hypothetical protein
MRGRIQLCLVSVFAVLVVLAAAPNLSAQTFRGTILGTVTDPSGAILAGAKVTVKNTGTGLERSTETSADGSYSLPELPIGTYNVTVTQVGFQTFVATGVVLDVSAERRINAVLKPGQVSTTVEVAGEFLPQVETTSTEIGGTLTSDAIESLPVNGRDYQKLIFMNPGVAGSPDQITDSPGSYGVFSMNGSRGRSNNFLLDGTDMNDGYRNDPAINEAGVFGDPATILPLDAVAELKVISNYEAEYGRNSGAVIDIVTKSGTNGLHGSALEYLRTNDLGARNFFNNVGGENPFHNNQFGGSLGGPVVKDHTFFFFDYEGQRESGAQGGLSCVPDPAQIAADKTAITGKGLQVNPVATSLLGFFPSPNVSGAYGGSLVGMEDSGCPNGPDLSTATIFTNSVDSLIGKIDQNFVSGLLTGRYYFGNSIQSFPFAQLAGGLLPGFNTVTPTRVQLVSISYVKNVNPSQVNEARLGWNRFAEQFYPQDHTFNPGSIGLDTGVTNPFDFGLPQVTVTGFSPVGATNSIPRRRVDSNWHFIDNYSWKIGRHDVKFGYEFRRTTIQLVQDNTFRGKLGFSSASVSPLTPNGGALTALLEGVPSSGEIAQGDTLRHDAENNHSFYIQDEFRMTQRLTINYGLRWDYFGVVHEKNNLFYQMSAANGGTEVQVGSPGGPGSLYNPDYNNFAPRIGLAYDFTGKGQTVVRAGWGLFYDAFSQDIFLGHVPYNCAFCPGPAYAGVGPAAIYSAGLSGNTLGNGPLFSGPAPLGDFFGTDPNIRTPYVQNFNLNLQQQLGSKMVLQVGYVGAIGTKLFRFRDLNQPTQAQITAYDSSCPIPHVPPATFPNCPIAGYDYASNVPRTVFPNYFYVNQEESTANSNYHALQTSLRVNGWHGLASQANFVWSHSIDNASDLEDFIPNAAQPNNSFNTAAERGNSNFDIRRRFSWNLGYELPKHGGNLAKLRDGWGVDSAVTLQDGQPFNFNYNFEGDYSGGGEGFDRPDVVGPIQYGSAPFNFINLASFQVPCTFGNTSNIGGIGDSNCLAGTRHFGDMGRNSLRASTFKEWNFSVFKNTAISERVNLQLRAEFFNFLNHPNFSDPILPGYISDPATNGLDPNGRGIGNLALTATGDVGIGNPFLGGGGPRGVQFAAIFKF